MAQTRKPLGRAVFAAVVAVWVLYLVAVWANREAHEDLLAPLGVVPVVLVGLLYGRRMGLAGALVLVIISFVIHMVHGAGDSPLYDVRENALRWVVGAGLGYGSGLLTDLLRQQRRTMAALEQEMAARSKAERSLASRQRTWETLLSNAPDYILVIDAAMRVRHANRTPPGLTLSQVLGQDIGAFVPDDAQRQALIDALQRAIQGGAPSTVHLRGAGPNGALSDYRCRIVSTTDEDGAPAALMMNVDITHELEAKELLADRNKQLERANRLLEEAQSIAHIGSWEADLATGLATESKEAWRIWGLPGEPEPRPVTDFLALIHPDDKAALDLQVGQALQRGEDYESLLRIRGTEPGTWRHVRNRGRIAGRGPDGQATKMAGTLEDITALLAAEQRLRTSEERFRLAMRATRDVLWDLDVPTGRLTWGGSMKEVFGHDVAELAPDLSSWDAHIHPEDLEGASGSFTASLNGTDETWHAEYRFRRADGTYATVLDRAFLQRDASGKVVRAVGAMADVTVQREAEAHAREAERLREVAQFKTQFLNNAAHELATPMTPLKLQLASLRANAGQLPTRERDALDLLERNVNRMGLLVNDLLDAARLQSGRIRIDPKPTLLDPVVKQVVASFAEMARQNGLALAADVKDARLVADCDGARVQQVLFNLVSNALKFTSSQVRVGVRREGSEVVFEVQDDGVGLDRAQMDRLFQPFTQVHDPTKVRAGGTGLGLYVSRGIVEQHGGKLSVASEGPDHGTTFTVRLPLKMAQVPAAPASSSPATNATAQPRAGDARGARPGRP